MSDLINGRMPEEIKAGLWRCLNPAGKACSGCPYDRACPKHPPEVDALDLIKHLESERNAALAKVLRWISVEERLPEKSGKYIVCTEKNSVYATKYRTGYDRGGFGCDINTHVTHWMPLPEPPKKDAHCAFGDRKEGD